MSTKTEDNPTGWPACWPDHWTPGGEKMVDARDRLAQEPNAPTLHDVLRPMVAMFRAMEALSERVEAFGFAAYVDPEQFGAASAEVEQVCAQVQRYAPAIAKRYVGPAGAAGAAEAAQASAAERFALVISAVLNTEVTGIDFVVEHLPVWAWD